MTSVPSDLAGQGIQGDHPHPSGALRRVCFFLNSWTFGGVEEHVALLCSRLPTLGYEPLVVCLQLDALRPLFDRLEALGVRRHPFEARQGPLGKSRSVMALARLLTSEHIDILHLQLIFTDGGRLPLLSARLAGVPVVVTHHAAPRAAQDPVARWMRRPILSLADRFIAVSHANRADQIRYMGLPSDRLTPIHNGIAVSAEAPDRKAAHDRLTAELGLPPEAKLVGAMGRLCEQKGFHLLLEAAAKVVPSVPDAHFVLAGDGPLRTELEAQAVRLGLEKAVHFLGFRNDAPHLLAALDLLAMPSVFEGLPLVLLEAFAAGCPVVAHAVDGIPEVIDDAVNGFLVPAGDVDLLHARIVRLLQDDELAAQIGGAARKKALRSLTAERMARDTASLYDGTLDEARRRLNPVTHAVRRSFMPGSRLRN